MFLNRFSFLVLIAVFPGFLCGADAAGMQRMLLLPQTLSLGPSSSARANAMCLDEFRDTPARGAKFATAPTDFGDVQVSVANGPPISLQRAIDQRVIEIEGVGNYEQLSFKSLTDKPVNITIRKTSVISPDSAYEMKDLLGLPQLKTTKATFSQDELWKTRETQTAKRIGVDPNKLDSTKYDADVYQMSDLQGWTRKAAEKPEQASFVVWRLEGGWKDPPRYYLFTADGPPRSFTGNAELGRLTTELEKVWRRTGRKPPPRIAMVGDGDPQDFDAARLTMEVSSNGRGGGGRDGNVPVLNFERPPGDPPGGQADMFVYDGKPWRTLQVAARREGRYSATQSFFDRGKFLIFSKTSELFGKIAAAIRGYVIEPGVQAASRSEVLAEVESRVKAVAEQAYRENSTLKKGQAGFQAIIDGQTSQQFFVDNDSLRFARSSQEQ
jgi:hypothetical protein